MRLQTTWPPVLYPRLIRGFQKAASSLPLGLCLLTAYQQWQLHQPLLLPSHSSALKVRMAVFQLAFKSCPTYRHPDYQTRGSSKTGFMNHCLSAPGFCQGSYWSSLQRTLEKVRLPQPVMVSFSLGDFDLFFFLSHFYHKQQRENSPSFPHLAQKSQEINIQVLCFCLPECQSAKSRHCNEDHLSPVSKHRALLLSGTSPAYNVGIPSNILFVVQMYSLQHWPPSPQFTSYPSKPSPELSVNSLSKAKQPF